MDHRMGWAMACCAGLAMGLGAGCASSYKGVVAERAPLSELSPELEGLTDQKIELYLKAGAQPVFPTSLAVAKLAGVTMFDHGNGTRSMVRDSRQLAVMQPDEAEGWKSLTELRGMTGKPLVDRVHIINSLLASGDADLKKLRDAAAMLHAPVLLVYMQNDASASGVNDAAMAYWTIVGLFTVPGHTVGHHCVCQGLLVDTRSGAILASLEGQSLREEKVLAGAVDIAAGRTRREARAESADKLREESRQALRTVAMRGQ